MGLIMAVGVSVSNAVLVVDQAELSRKRNLTSSAIASRHAVEGRFRPILMTALAMIAGMTPMALGLGEGGSQVAPLGQAVIGGLVFATLTSLFILPFIYQMAFARVSPRRVSLDPDDMESNYFEKS